jgi:hypothetical protein
MTTVQGGRGPPLAPFHAIAGVQGSGDGVSAVLENVKEQSATLHLPPILVVIHYKFDDTKVQIRLAICT